MSEISNAELNEIAKATTEAAWKVMMEKSPDSMVIGDMLECAAFVASTMVGNIILMGADQASLPAEHMPDALRQGMSDFVRRLANAAVQSLPVYVQAYECERTPR